jgi:hypothetical protein
MGDGAGQGTGSGLYGRFETGEMKNYATIEQKFGKSNPAAPQATEWLVSSNVGQ